MPVRGDWSSGHNTVPGMASTEMIDSVNTLVKGLDASLWSWMPARGDWGNSHNTVPGKASMEMINSVNTLVTGLDATTWLLGQQSQHVTLYGQYRDDGQCK